MRQSLFRHRIGSGTWASPRARRGAKPAGSVVSVRAEMDTEWFPDAWGWTEVSPPQADSCDLLQADELKLETVPFVGTRSRTVPLIPLRQRLLFQRAALELLARLDRTLKDGVIAYRLNRNGLFEHYRDARLRRHQLEEHLMARYPVVVKLDLKRFFRRITTATLDSCFGDHADWVTLRPVVQSFERQLGYALPEGYAASRAVANLTLRDVDAVLASRFMRWVDDYHVFCRDTSEVESVVTTVENLLAALGFEMSASKTEILSSKDLWLTDVSVVPSADYDAPPPELIRRARDAHPRERERLLRHALSEGAQRHDELVVPLLAEWPAADVPPAALPRLAWMLASSSWSESSLSLIRGQLNLEDEFKSWRVGRLGYALWYAPSTFVNPLLDEVHDVFRNRIGGASAIARLYAKHSPDRLGSVLPSGNDYDSRRIARLAYAELSASRDELAENEGPPVKSYL